MKIILDVSNIVYGGHYANPEYRINGFPMGGVRKLLGIINAESRDKDVFLCMDGGATMKKELYPEYKAGRVPNYSVAAQLDLLQEIFGDCNIPYYKEDGVEADDFICSLVHFFEFTQDPDEITIISDDRDISCCVSPTVSVRNATSNGICLNYDNFEKRAVNGATVPYNAILVHKMFNGDKSDGYGGLRIPGLKYEDLAYRFLNAMAPFLEDNAMPHSVHMNLQAMDIVIDSLGDNVSQADKDTLKKQAKLVFPQLLDVTHNGLEAYFRDRDTSGDPLYRAQHRALKVCSMANMRTSNFNYYCTILGLNRARPERISFSMGEKDTEFKELLSLRAKELSTGVTAAKHYKRRRESAQSEPTMSNMELPL